LFAAIVNEESIVPSLMLAYDTAVFEYGTEKFAAQMASAPVSENVTSQTIVQTQVEFWHCRPVPQLTHAFPPSPHAELAVPGWQAPVPSQQPLGQEAALHTHAPSSHSCPAAHATHAAPAGPHVALFELLGGFTHVEPLQHPSGQSSGAQ